MNNIVEVPTREIKVGAHEQRLAEDDSELDGLAASIRRLGVLIPLILEKKGDTFQLVSGHRRLLAAIRVGLSTVPCVVKSGVEVDAGEVTFAENFFRKDLSPIELAAALKDCLDNEKMTLKEIAAGFHKSEHWVRRMVAICQWPGDVQEAIHAKAISVSAASNLALVTDESYRVFLLRNAAESGATARTTAAWLQAWQAMQPPEEAIQAQPVQAGPAQVPLVPQGPCLSCAQIFPVNEMSHVPLCGACIMIIRTVGMKQG